MKLVKPSYEIIEQGEGLEGMYKHIELAGRTCYKSEDKITEDSADKFVKAMIKSGHGAMLEHGTVYLKTTVEDFTNGTLNNKNKWDVLRVNPFTRVRECWGNVYITTNYRVIIENGLQDLLEKYISEPTEFHEKRITVKFVCDRGVSHEFVRHRVFSFAQESTRYCNYGKDKFGNELTFIIPSWVEDVPDNTVLHDNIDVTNFVWKTTDTGKDLVVSKFTQTFLYNCSRTETDYLGLVNNGYTAQQARDVLSFSIKSPLVMTGFVSDWKHFFDLRALGTTGAPHPQAKELAEPLMKEFEERKYI